MAVLIVAVAAGVAAAGLLATVAPAAVRLARVVAVLPVVAVAAVVGALAAGDPTGTPVVDGLLAAVLVALATLGAAVTAPVHLAVLAAVAVAAHALGEPASVASAATALGAGLALGRLALPGSTRMPAPVPAASLPGAVAGGLVAVGCLGLAWPDVTGGPSLVAAVVVGPLALLGLSRGLPPAGRRRAATAVAALVILAGLAAGAAAVAAGLSYRDLDAAVRAARQGLDAARDAERERAAARFESAGASFAEARGTLDSWWARPALAVPLAAQHLRAARTAAASGAELSAAAADEARGVDPDSIRLVDGQLDLAAVATLEPALERTRAALDRAEHRLRAARSPWLLGMVADRVGELETEVLGAAADAEQALDAVRTVPAMLGADGPRRYFLAVVTPAELRGSGGIVGNWGEITAIDGRLDLARFGRIRELDGAGPRVRELEEPAEYVARYARFGPQQFWTNVTLSPDFPTVAEVIAHLYPQSGGAPLDGVLAVDPIGLAAVLELTGPVDVPDWPEPLSAENAAGVLLHEQYLAFPRADDDLREDFLGDATEEIWRRLTTGTVPGPATLGRVFGPVVADRHVQLVTFEPDERAYLERLGATGAVPPVRGDSFGVVTQNGYGNKIDWFLRREIHYQVVAHDAATGELEADATVVLRNEAPGEGLPISVIGAAGEVEPPQPRLGQSRLYTSLYTPLEVTGASLDGQQVPLTVERELGRNVYSLFVEIPPGDRVVVRLRLAGRIEPGAYRFDLLRQPTAHPDEVRVPGPR